MLILSSFTHPHVILKLYDVLFFGTSKNIFCQYNKVNILQNIFCVLKMKENHVENDMKVTGLKFLSELAL